MYTYGFPESVLALPDLHRAVVLPHHSTSHGKPADRADCHTYEGASAANWLEMKHSSPMTRTPMEASTLRDNRLALSFIDAVRQNWPLQDFQERLQVSKFCETVHV